MEVKILKEIKNQQFNPKTVFQWIDFLDLTKAESKEFIQTIDKLVENYQIILKEDKLYLGEDEGYYQGQIRTNRRGFGFIDFEDRPSIYVSKDSLQNVYDKDTIVVQVLPKTDEGKVVKVLKRNLKRIVGVVLTRRKPVKFIADNLMYENKIKIKNIDDFKNIHRHKVLLEVVSFEEGYILCEIKDVLGYADDPGVDILSVLIENEIRTQWPKEVKAIVAEIPEKISQKDIQDRLDLRDQLIFTIDGIDAKDLDDAISISKKGVNYLLGVHIVDVEHYVSKNSPIDIEASKRGTSVYVVDRVVSMLPPQLSNGICSLNPHEDRLAISLMMEINKNGNVVNYEIKKSVINSKHRLNYKMVNEVLKDKNSVLDYQEIYPSLKMMEDLSKILQIRRDNLGAIDFDKDEAKIEVDKNGNVIDIKLRERGISEKIIENFMVTANEVVARLMAWSDWPALYRVHEKPDAAKMRDFAGFAQILGYQLKGNMSDIHPRQLQKILSESANSKYHFVLSTQLLRSMQKARYDHNNLGHFGLGSLEYAHFTSPIRRYPDLLLHRMLKKYLFQNDFTNMDEDLKTMAKFAKETSAAERRAVSAEREVNDMKMAEYMEDKINETYEGIITSVHNFGVFVQLPNLIEGLVRIDSMPGYFTLDSSGFKLEDKANNKSYSIGQKIKVVVVGASKQTRNIDFEIIEKKRGNKK